MLVRGGDLPISAESSQPAVARARDGRIRRRRQVVWRLPLRRQRPPATSLKPKNIAESSQAPRSARAFASSNLRSVRSVSHDASSSDSASHSLRETPKKSPP